MTLRLASTIWPSAAFENSAPVPLAIEASWRL